MERAGPVNTAQIYPPLYNWVFILGSEIVFLIRNLQQPQGVISNYQSYLLIFIFIIIIIIILIINFLFVPTISYLYSSVPMAG